MIEEAAGTRLYESKKEAAQRTIEKKDTKLKEIDTVWHIYHFRWQKVIKSKLSVVTAVGNMLGLAIDMFWKGIMQSMFKLS